MNKNKNLYLTGSVVILFLLYIFSFFTRTVDKKIIVKTALVNKKYENNITSFELSKENEKIYLQRKDNLWLCSKDNDAKSFIPADKNFIDNMIKDLIKVINVYKISDNLPQNNNFGLNSESTFVLKYNDVNELYFGNYDFSKTSRYLMTGKNTKVYEMDTSIDKYLSTSFQNWCDPFIISKQIINLKPADIQSITIFYPEEQISKKVKDISTDNLSKLLELRHGGTPNYENIGDSIFKLELECGDTSEIKINLYATKDETEYNVNCYYFTGLDKKRYEFNVKISSWTYNKIKEIML